MAQQTNSTSFPPSNGILSAPTGRGVVGGNKKNKKKRAKNGRQNYDEEEMPSTVGMSGNMSGISQPLPPLSNPHPSAQYHEPELTVQDDYDAQGDYYTDDEDEILAYEAAAHGHHNGAYVEPQTGASKKKNKRKKKRRNTHDSDDDPLIPPRETYEFLDRALASMPRRPTPPEVLRTDQPLRPKDRIWNTSTYEERERIKEFWLSLSERDRRDLLKIEKEAVLRKMKEQQKHSCSCTVCGRKRTAIEEELEVLYDAYYEELEQYANHQHDDIASPHPPLPRRLKPHLATPVSRGYPLPPKPLNISQPQHRTSRVQEIIDDGEPEEYSDEEEDDEDDEEDDEEEYSDEEDEIYSSEEYEDEIPRRSLGGGFFDFGNSLTVKGRSFITDMLTQWQARLNSAPGGILTVADDLLKNDGKKFIEMMEQLAERRMQREQDAEYAAQQPSHLHSNGEPPLDDEEDDYDDDYSDEYDEDEEEEEDEMVLNCPDWYDMRLMNCRVV